MAKLGASTCRRRATQRQALAGGTRKSRDPAPETPERGAAK